MLAIVFMTTNVLDVLGSTKLALPFPFNRSILPKENFADYLLYQQHKKPILKQVVQDFLAQNTDNQQLLSPKILISKPTRNPTNLTNPYWQWLVQNNISAYDLNRLEPTQNYGPLWSMGRIGQSSTLLPDGREILIGGEIEDYYDPLFWIYNDVIVKHPEGNIEIFGYPRHIFAPTDFHTATLVGDDIWIIGSAGYVDERDFSQTSVYKLNIYTYKIEKVETRNSMGWVFKHSAVLKNNEIIIQGGDFLTADNYRLENFDIWALNLKTLIWKNLTKRQWQVFFIQRKDGDWLHLSEYDSVMAYEDKPESQSYQEYFAKLTHAIGKTPDLESYRQLFLPPLKHEIDGNAQAYQTYTIFIDDIKVRYKNDDDNIQVYIEGKLSADKLELLQENLRHKLSKLENFACEIKTLF